MVIIIFFFFFYFAFTMFFMLITKNEHEIELTYRRFSLSTYLYTTVLVTAILYVASVKLHTFHDQDCSMIRNLSTGTYYIHPGHYESVINWICYLSNHLSVNFLIQFVFKFQQKSIWTRSRFVICLKFSWSYL